jgi:hypothetical protein
MPRVSGYEVLPRLADAPTLAGRHAYLVLTAAPLRVPYIGPRFADLMHRLRAAFLAKPFELDALLRQVTRLHAELRGGVRAGGARCPSPNGSG